MTATTDQTRILRFSSETIPAALPQMPGWVVSSPDKIPYDPRTIRRADPTNPATGGTFTEAVAAVRRHRRFDRLGLILPGGLLGLDWDDCVDAETGVVDPDILT